MPELKPSAIKLFSEYSAAINKCRKEISAQNWFKDGWWTSVEFGTRGFGFQISKTSWHNHNRQGVHFEFWIEENEHQTKVLPIVLHFEPDTPDRKKLGEKFKKAFKAMESEFPDYKINHAAVCDKMQKNEKFTKGGLHKTIVREFSRLQEIAPIIDKILS